MTESRTHRTRRGRRPARRTMALVNLTVVATLFALLALPATTAWAATATVGNGVTTTDLNSVGVTPTTLASTLVGSGVTVSNVTYSGANPQAGLLHVVDPAVVSFNDGIILSSGNIADVVGPNKSDGTTGDMAGPADPDLNALIANTQTVNPVTFDAASLEFDFVPTASQVYFTYTFGSDEYLEWVNLFNDVFAFFVNGQNCAVVPGNSPVSIDTINSTVNPNLFRDNSFSSPPPSPINIESDGLSVEMICSATVTPNQTNHMKLAIADTSDQILDSVVMIKAQSLSTTKPESCNDSVDNNDDTLVDMNDPLCQATTTPPPVGSGGIGSSGGAPPFTGNEGTPITLDASTLGWTATPDAVGTSWTVTGINGTPGTCDVSPVGTLPVNPDGSIAVATATCPNEGEYVARVNGWDVEGKSAFDNDVDFFVHNAPPTVAITSPTAGAQATVGGPVDVSATVTDPGVNDSLTCAITWGDGTIEPGTLASGTCTGTHTYGSAGTPIISVAATDDAGDTAATATVLTVVAPDAPVTVASSANPSVVGQPVTLTGSTSLGTTGKMSFYDGATLLGTRTVAGGTANLLTSALSAGIHSITASYLPTSTSTPSTSAALIQQVDPAATATTLTSSANPSVAGQTITLKATATRLAPATRRVSGGSVVFSDNGIPLATKSAVGGVASLAIKTLSTGGHSITAEFTGSTTDLPSASTPLSQAVGQATTSLTLTTTTTSTSVFSQKVTLKAAVKRVAPASLAPAGTVDFYDELGPIALAVPLSTSGVASVAVTNLPVGLHGIHADYSGSPDDLSSSAVVLHQVDPAATTATLTAVPLTTTAGKTVTLTTVVKRTAPATAIPDGTVTLYDNGHPLATGVLTSGKFVWKTTALAVGTHTLTALYGGNGSTFTGSVSTTVTVIIT
jgi:hypothetical protein